MVVDEPRPLRNSNRAWSHSLRRMVVLVAAAAGGLVSGSACQSGDPDRLRYLEVIASREMAAGSAFSACAELGDVDLGGDCQLAIIQRLRDEDLSGWCAGFSPGKWQDECWFLEAERRRAMDQIAPSARACEKTGAYREDCAI